MKIMKQRIKEETDSDVEEEQDERGDEEKMKRIAEAMRKTFGTDPEDEREGKKLEARYFRPSTKKKEKK
jgi:hypothetical protein